MQAQLALYRSLRSKRLLCRSRGNKHS